MEKNKLILKVGLMLIALSLVFCIGAAFYLKLDIPVFFKNYGEIYLYKTEDGRYENNNFTLNYLTNSSDTRTVTDIYLKGAPELDFGASEYDFWGWWPISSQNNNLGNIFGRYSLRTVYIKIYPSPEKSLDATEIEDLVINFDNGDVMTTNIGKIVLKEDQTNREYVSRDGASSSSDGTASSNYLVLRDVTLEKLDSPFLEYIKDNVEITVDGKDYRDISGMEYKAGDRFHINSYLKTPNDILAKYTFVDFDFDLYFKDTEGNMHSTRSHYIDYQTHYSNLSTKDIISYLKSRGAI